MATTIDKVHRLIKSALDLLEKVAVKPEKAEAVIEAAAAVSAEEAHTAPEAVAVATDSATGGVNRSEKIREYFNKHGMDVRNKDVIDYIKKTYNTEVGPAHVSIIRKNMSQSKAAPKAKAKAKTAKASTTAKVKAKAKAKVVAVKKDLGGLPMGTLCTNLLKKHGARDGLKLSELTDLVIKSGYSYKGDKGRDGVLQNVYQALHSLAKEGSHPGYKDETPVIVKDPASKRYKLNPKAKTKKVA